MFRFLTMKLRKQDHKPWRSFKLSSVKRSAYKTLNPLSYVHCSPFLGPNNEELVVKYYRSNQLRSPLIKWILALFTENMKTLYEGSEWGFDIAAKTRELFSRNARYLICFSKSENSYTPCAFVHFRYSSLHNKDAIYCYELQIEKTFQRIGLGHYLLDILEKIAFRLGFTCVGATVFSNNTASWSFFSKNGYRSFPLKTNGIYEFVKMLSNSK